jgi:hypothetical protein
MEKTEGATHLAPQGISEEDMLKFVESKCVQFGIWSAATGVIERRIS